MNMMRHTRGFLLVSTALTTLLGLGLAAVPGQVLDVLPFFEPWASPPAVAFLRLLGILLFGTSLALGLLVPAELSPLGQSVLVAIFAPLAVVCLLLPLGAREEEPLAWTRVPVRASLLCIVVSVAVNLFRHGTFSRKTARQRALEEIGEAAAQQERSRLARDLHDSIKQQLFSIKLSSAAVEERWERDPRGARSALADVRGSAQAAMVEMQALLTQLRPEPLAADGLVEALREQCEALGFRTGARVDFEVGDLPPDDRLPASARESLFRIAQEALSNVARHARAGSVRVRLGTVEGSGGPALGLAVEDDGQGFDPEVPPSGMGLRNMRERLEPLGGTLAIDSAPGRGTRLSASIALAPPATEETADDYPFLIKLAVVPALISLFVDSPEPFWWAVGLFFTGQGSLKVYRAESKGMAVELARLFHQQLFFLSALAFWWMCGEAPGPPAGRLSWLDWILSIPEYVGAYALPPLAAGLACWEAWRFLRLRRVRSGLEPLHSPWLFAAVLGLFLASLPALWLADPETVGSVAARLASALYVAWFLRLLSAEVQP